MPNAEDERMKREAEGNNSCKILRAERVRTFAFLLLPFAFEL
jgi:hypothetical protein